MAAQIEIPEERLKSFLHQLQAEYGILDRIIYKNKNQHRRSNYFQYLLKVRRDLKLFQTIHLEELLDSCFNVVTGRKAKQKAHLLESLKRKKCDSGKYNFIERLQGAARLLSEMVEPMLKAATEISTLLARSFFMGFCVVVLALLARLRVLVQQCLLKDWSFARTSAVCMQYVMMLLDVVLVYNEISSLAQRKQSIKITQDGLEVFREYYPTMEEEIDVLECVWKTDKFVLVETSGKGKISHQGASSETTQALGTSIQYQSIDSFLGDDEFDHENADAKEGEESLSNAKRTKPGSPPLTCNENISLAEQVQLPSAVEHSSVNILQPDESTSLGGGSHVSSLNLPGSSSSTSIKRVAFISVKPTAPLASNEEAVSQVNGSTDKKNDDGDNALFSFFNEEETRGSIF